MHAPNVWTADLSDISHSPLTQRTNLNPETESAALGQPEIVRWTSDPGVEVEGVLIKPHGYVEGQRYPFIVQVHGGPTGLWSNQFAATWHDWAQSLASRGFAVLMPNPRGSTGRGPDYSNAIFGDVGGGEYRDMMSGVDAMIARGIADPERLGVGGWSWGGYMTAWTVTQTNRFKAAVMGAGLPNMISDNGLGDIPSANLSYFETTPYHDPDPYFERSAIRHIRNAKTPTLILHGEADDRVSPAEGREMYIALRTLGVETQFVTYPRERHSFTERKHQLDLIRRVVEWYEQHLGA
jgi:dipeptidyl aminopeptidase/acylaminoacyl peptidase